MAEAPAADPPRPSAPEPKPAGAGAPIPAPKTRRRLSVELLVRAVIILAALAVVVLLTTQWDAWIVPGDAPTRCCGEVKLADPAMKVEIVVVAAR